MLGFFSPKVVRRWLQSLAGTVGREVPKPISCQVKLGLEALEERQLLAASALFTHGLITITGTRQADHVRIVDQGNGPGATVSVLVEGRQVLQVAGNQVNAIQCNMGKGDDVINYDLAGTLARGSRAIGSSLGRGNDTFAAHLQASIEHSKVCLDARGGAGKDALRLDTSAGNFSIGPEARIDCAFFGGEGQDALGVAAYGPIQATAEMNVYLDGGRDSDTLESIYSGIRNGSHNLTYLKDGKDSIHNVILGTSTGQLARDTEAQALQVKPAWMPTGDLSSIWPDTQLPEGTTLYPSEPEA